MSLPPLDMHCHPIHTTHYLAAHPRIDPASVSAVADESPVLFAMTMSPQEWAERGNFSPNGPVRSVWGLGLHPWEPQDPDQVASFLKLLPDCDAVGEIGLDSTFRAASDLTAQRNTFIGILDNEHTRERIVSVHGQDARAVIEVLEDHLCTGLVYHWFNASDRVTERAIALDIFYSVNHAVLSLPEGPAVVAALPRTRVFIETDAPVIDRTTGRALNPGDDETDDRPLWPGEVGTTEAEVGRIWGVDATTVRRQTWENLAELESRVQRSPFSAHLVLDDS